ncbi:MAG: ATP-binding protein [Gemmatimonadales bacterium]
MTNTRILQLMTALARDSEMRRRASFELARHLEADDLLVLTFEKVHSTYLPPCGFPQTLYQSRRWRAFTQETTANSFATARLVYPTADQERTARGWAASDGGILVLFDGAPNEAQVPEVLCLLPLLTPTFEKEHRIITSAANARLSAQAAQQARELAESLDSVRRQLQATVILREQDIAERERVEKELERSNTELQRVNDDLNQFTFAATHDVREPLRMMTIYVQLLQKELAGKLSETATECIQNVAIGGERISRLIDGLLQFTRLGGMAEIKPVPVDATLAVREAVGDLQMSVTENHAKLTVHELPIVMADPLHLRQVFQNLIANSMKYRHSELDPEIQISAKQDGDFWQFCVQDNGIGVASQHHDQIFLPFKRLHGSDIAGAGIGLATCKRVIERYGGRIWIESEENRGAIFYFSLPAEKADPHANS